MEFVMLVGLPASGKSKWASHLKDIGYIVHSSDAIRYELFGDESSQENNKKVFKVLHDRVFNDLTAGNNVVYDACNISDKYRGAFLQRIKNIKGLVKKCYVMATPYDICLEMNNERDRKVPEFVIERMYKNFTAPYYNEGWDSIQILYYSDDIELRNFDDYVNKLVDYSQDNSHHNLTLGNHMLKCKDRAFANGCLPVVYAANFHDIGKPIVKSFTNSKGESTSEAHYYNHENVGAYEFLFVDDFMLTDSDILHICFLIQNHMRPYQFDKGASPEKCKNRWGEKLFEEVMQLHKCDVEAH